MSRIEKTNAMRLLDQRRIAYEAFDYDSDIHSADGVAAALGLDPATVYKTLVVLRERTGARPMLVMAPGNKEVDLRMLARSVGEKAVRMAPQREAERLTGLLVGGIGALALVGKAFDVFIDRESQSHERILVNGGRRGLNLKVAVVDLIAVTGAKSVTC